MMILVIFMLFKYKINIFHPLLIYIYMIMSIISFLIYFIPYFVYVIMSIISFLIYLISYIVKETLYFLKIIKQISEENKEKFKLISDENVKK